MDRTGIAGGASYGREIVTAIRGSTVLLLCCSAAAFASRNVRQEVALAWKHERPILPLLLEPVDVPDELAYWLEAAQWVELLDRADEVWLPEVTRALHWLGVAVAPPGAAPSAELVATQGGDGNLPASTTPLIGRDADVVAIGKLLRRPGARLVTLTGPGGVGKTRLALAIAGELQTAFPDGAWFVPLAPLSDPRQVLPAIAQALGMRDEGPDSVALRLGAFLSRKRVLLVIDNVEHLTAATPGLAKLLAQAAETSILATSRTPLHLSGEHEVSVNPLRIPARGTPISVDEAADFPAVRLFVERSEAVRPGFLLTAANTPAIVAICTQLDGLPLAIELAAARSKLLSPPALLDRLDRRLPVLSGGARDLPARQQTLRNAISWSYDLLTDDERQLFRQVGVFVDGFSFEAAEAVTGVDAGTDVFDGLSSLVNNSLVGHSDTGGEARFTMLETIREFALERLTYHGEEPAIRDAHATFYLAFIRTAGADVEHGRNYVQRLTQIDAELGNLRAALGWLLETGGAVAALELLGASHRYWTSRPYLAEVGRWMDRALDAAPDAAPELRAKALHMAVCAAAMQGDDATAERRAEEAVTVAETTGDPFTLACAYYDVGLAADLRGDGAAAVAPCREAVRLLRQTGPEWWIAWSLAELGDKLAWLGQLDEAIPMLEEALDRCAHAQLPWGVAMVTGQRAHAARLQGDQARAARLFAESIRVARSISERRIEIGAVAGLAGVAHALGESVRAARLLGAAEAGRDATGIGSIAHTLHATRIMDEVHAALGEAAFAAAWADGQRSTVEATLADALAFAEHVAGSDHVEIQ